MIDSKVHTEAVIRNAFCSYYGKTPRGFTRALVSETCNLLGMTNTIYQGNDVRTDVLFSRQSILEYVNNLHERRKGNLSPEQVKLVNKVSKLDYETIYKALDSFGSYIYRASSIRNARGVIQRLQKGKLCEEKVEEQEEVIAGSDIEYILNGFVEVRGLYFPRGHKGGTHTIKVDGDKELCVMNPSGGLDIENTIDNQFLDKLISSFGGTGLIDSQLAAKLRAIELPEFVSIGIQGKYYWQGNSFQVRSQWDDKSYLVIGISEPPQVISRDQNLKKWIDGYLRNEDLMCAVNIQRIAENYNVNPVDFMDFMIKLLKERRIKVTIEHDQLVFHGSNKSSNTLRDIFAGLYRL